MDRLATLIWLKLAMWRHGLRTGAGVADVMAGVGLSIVAGLISLGVTAGLGAAMHFSLAEGSTRALLKGLLVIFHAAAVLAVAGRAVAHPGGSGRGAGAVAEIDTPTPRVV